MKAIKAVYRAGYTDYDGLDTYRAFPSRNLPIDALDPFLFLNHHGHQVYGPGNSGLPFGPHPHKGFETVTFIVEGDLVHQDSTGFSSNIREGGIQWMTAGRGIIHSETSSEEFRENGGPIEILQLWVNLPSHLKTTPPAYVGLQKEEVPALKFDEGRVSVNLVSGSWDSHEAPIQSISDVTLASIELKEGGSLNLSVPEGNTLLFYVVKGSLSVNRTQVEQHDLVEFDRRGSKLEIEALEDALIIFGHAQPTNEPVVAHGPFVMNSQEEIRQAFVEYQQGKLGVWNN
jgi:redox-sensitive bicupin YhaK (pirin superfamily)